MNAKRSEKAYIEACKFLPGGVNSPVRSFRHLKATPVFIKKAKGPYLFDIDENRYIDYCLSWGVAVLGHAHEKVVKASIKAVENGSSFGTATVYETQLASLITSVIPSIELIRFVNSGTEAVMSAIRLARAYTNRKIIIKFDGCYHGHSDSLLVKAGSGLTQLPDKSSEGVIAESIQYTISLPYNNIQALIDYFRENGYQVAAIILELVPGNMGVIKPELKFLETIQDLSNKYKCLIIADEVITGFRFKEITAQQHFGIIPHLTILGKIIGGGFPIGAFGGKREIMELLSPIGPVYQAGTLSGNPVAMNAGLVTIEELLKPLNRRKLFDLANDFFSELQKALRTFRVQIQHAGSMFSLFLTDKPLTCFDHVTELSDTSFAQFYLHLLKKNIYLSPSKAEANFISLAHDEKTLDKTIEKIISVIKKNT